MAEPKLESSTRAILYQVLMLAIVIAIALLVFHTTRQNLEQLGVDSGFDFLARRAGFDIGQSLISYTPDSTIARAFLVALLNTFLLAAAAIVLSSALGFFIGISRLSTNWLLAKLAALYVDVFRNIPVLLQIFFWYFVVLRSLPRSRDSVGLFDVIFINNRGLFFPRPQLESGAWIVVLAIIVSVVLVFLMRAWARRRLDRTGQTVKVMSGSLAILVGLPLLAAALTGFPVSWTVPALGRFGYEGGMVLIPEFLALTVGLSIYNATYISEIVRSAFQAIPRGQTEAAEVLGLSRGATVRLILLPQALRIMIPPLTTVYLNLFKATSLAAAIAYPEVVSVFVGTVNNLVGRPLEIMAITLVLYVSVSLCIALFMNWYNRRAALKS